jgi:hypothetical protein
MEAATSHGYTRQRASTSATPRTLEPLSADMQPNTRNRVPARLASMKHSAAASPRPSPQDKDEGMVVVWDGPRPRLMRKLRMSFGAPEPDFSSAHSRALITAMRLGLPSAEQYAKAEEASTGPGRMSPRTATAAAAKIAPEYSASPRAKTSARSPRPGSEPWAGDADYLDQLSSKVSAVQRYIARQGPDRARATTADLGAVWRMPSHSVDSPRLHMQSALPMGSHARKPRERFPSSAHPRA